jgi:glycosyltransferase involved in cell wall biosynthesis
MPTAPLVSVVMSVYNSEKTLARAMDSMLSQTYQNIEIIIVDDASEDCSLEMLKEYAKNNNKIKLIHNNKNMGLAWSLNNAILNSKGLYIARMDSDDKSYKNRIEKQVIFLENNLKVDVLGTASKYVELDYSLIKDVIMPRYHEECVAILSKTTPFIHPTVMIRRTFFDKVGLYDKTLRKAQDYELWARGMRLGNYANIPDILFEYTVQRNKSYKTTFQELKVRTMCSYKYNFFFSSLRYSIVGFILVLVSKH